MATVSDSDQLLRVAAFNAVKALAAVRGDLTSADLKAGFEFEGKRVPLVNPQRGIFKPQQMRYLLSIRTESRSPKSITRHSMRTSSASIPISAFMSQRNC